MTNIKQSGFSLVELAVTMVIIGLLTAGVVSGAHLMQTAKLNSVISEFKGYQTAIEDFRLKYNAWPGDMANAQTYWGLYNAGTNATGVNNGNGDERLGNGTGSDTLAEPLMAWKELALAGFIKGYYNGVDAGTPDFQVDVNVPGSAISKTAHYFLYNNTPTPIYGVMGTMLQLNSNDAATSPWGPAMKPADAYLIDQKMDDGSPATGKVLFYGGSMTPAGDCISGSTPVLTDDTVSCRMTLWLDK